ncbi:MAG: hypothetical protein KAR20_22840, partial [Candidatus Heimdallarchaeota archaeon]|nr:hypothetical protein [Candidatus Heimdallarchaeota archaeon]
MNSKNGLLCTIYAKFPKYIKIIIEDLLVFAGFLLILISFKMSILSSAGISVSIVLKKYVFLIISSFLPFQKITSEQKTYKWFQGGRVFLGFSILFMLILFVLRFFNAKPEFIAYLLVLFTIFFVLGWFYKR